jgi:uncharacterized repeat protein (TIGR01451 family)
MKKQIFAFLLVLTTFLAMAGSSLAAVRCETQYGGNEICVTTGELQIDKKILDPRSSDTYKDNLYLTDYQFKTSDYATFKLTVKNVGNDTLNNVKITDNLPSFLFFTGETSHEFTIEHLNPGESEDFIVKSRVVADSQIEADRICGVNTAEVWADGDQHDKDTSELCATKKVLGISILPETGFNSSSILLIASAITGLVGLVLIKLGKAK